MDNAVDVARAQIAEKRNEVGRLQNVIVDAETRIARLHREVIELDGWITTWHRLTGTPIPAATAAPKEEVSEPRTRRPKNPDRDIVANTALEIIRHYGSPMSRRDLFNNLKLYGIELHGKDPEMVLSTMLWRSQDRVVRLPNHGYWPKEMDYLPAGYHADTDELLGVAADEPEDGQIADDAD